MKPAAAQWKCDACICPTEIGKLKESWISGPSRPRYSIQYLVKQKNTIWGKNNKCMRRWMLKILAGHMIWGGLRPPPCDDSSCGPQVFSLFASACVLFICPILYLMFLDSSDCGHNVFLAACFISSLATTRPTTTITICQEVGVDVATLVDYADISVWIDANGEAGSQPHVQTLLRVGPNTTCARTRETFPLHSLFIYTYICIYRERENRVE